jgi:hypothetical protein
MKIKLILILLFSHSLMLGQMDTYRYKRKLIGVTDKWHSLTLPPSIFRTLQTVESEIRVYGITPKGDTVRAPLVLDVDYERSSSDRQWANVIDTEFGAYQYYYIIRMTDTAGINEVSLDFKQENFDWLVTLDGSDDLQNWSPVFSATEIGAISTANLVHNVSTLSFSTANYRYYRLGIEGYDTPVLLPPLFYLTTVTEGVYEFRKVKSVNIAEVPMTDYDEDDYYYDDYEEEETGQYETQITVELNRRVPVSRIELEVLDSHEFYRNYRIEVPNGSQYSSGQEEDFFESQSGVISSLSPVEFDLSNALIKKFRICVENEYSEPLEFGNVRVWGNRHRLRILLEPEATWYLVYGKDFSDYPTYHLTRFAHTIPAELKELELGPEEKIPVKEEPLRIAEAEEKRRSWGWLWILGTIVLVGGTIAVVMARRKKK